MISECLGAGLRPHRRPVLYLYWQRVTAECSALQFGLGYYFVSRKSAQCSYPIGNQTRSASQSPLGLAHAPLLHAMHSRQRLAAKTDRLSLLRRHKRYLHRQAVTYDDHGRSSAVHASNAMGYKSAVQYRLQASVDAVGI